MLENGATTLWEHWAFSDNTFSHSHPMFGSVSQWFFNWLAGIQPAADAVGFDSIIIAPQPVADLRWVRADHETARGRIASRWRRETTRMVYEIQIPVNASALVILHAAEAASVTESGVPIGEARGVAVVRRDEREIACRIGSGRYVFEVGLPQK